MQNYSSPPEARRRGKGRMLLASVATRGLLESKSFPVEITGGNTEYSGVVAENYGGHIASEGDVLHVTGNNKIYLVEDWFNLMDWPLVKYQKLHLLGSIMTFTVDMSGVSCDCNAAVYLVAMDEPGPEGANYCDIQATPPYPRCTEIDLVEGNIHAFATTLHTTEGTGVSRSHFQPASPSAARHASAQLVSASNHSIPLPVRRSPTARATRTGARATWASWRGLPPASARPTCTDRTRTPSTRSIRLR